MLRMNSFHKSNQSCNLSINHEFAIDLNGEKSENIFFIYPWTVMIECLLRKKMNNTNNEKIIKKNK